MKFINMYKFVVLITTFVSVQCTNPTIPAIIWGEGAGMISNQAVPALDVMPLEKFKSDIRPILNDEIYAKVFIFDDFQVEDFPHLENIQKMTKNHQFKYYSRAIKPAEAFTVNKNNSLNGIEMIKLKSRDQENDRRQTLKTFDSMIFDGCSSFLKSHKNSVCILTGEESPKNYANVLSRNLLEAEEAPVQDPLNVYFFPGTALFFTNSPPNLTITQSTTSTVYSLINITEPTSQGTSMAVNFKDKTKSSDKIGLVFNFQVYGNNWNLSSIKCTLNGGNPGLLLTTIPIGSSIGFSFHTPSNITFNDNTYRLVFNSLQVEYLNGNKQLTKFSVADDTVYFFTIPILSGLFVTSLLVTIVLIGLSMIFDIKTMDLFDDPKGKTVTINASE